MEGLQDVLGRSSGGFSNEQHHLHSALEPHFDMLSADFSRRGVLITCPAIVVPAMCMWSYRVHVMQTESKMMQARIDSLIGRLEAPAGGYRLCVLSMPTYLCLWPSAGDQAHIRISPHAHGTRCV